MDKEQTSDQARTLAKSDPPKAPPLPSKLLTKENRVTASSETHLHWCGTCAPRIRK